MELNQRNLQMPAAHRNNDSRTCGAKSVVQNQTTVFVNGELWAVKGTVNNHGDGQLINTTGSTVTIEGIPVIVHGPDNAQPDNADHPNPATAEGSSNVFAY
jgi:uncharacterized Zn-binding protein involved in type VI secretion